MCPRPNSTAPRAAAKAPSAPTAPRAAPLRHLLRTYCWPAIRLHPWRHAVAVLAVALGVALAFSVHLINASALDAFSQALRASTGQPDLEVFREAAGASVALSELNTLRHDPDVALALPVLEAPTLAFGSHDRSQRVNLRLLGVDALQIARIAPDLMPQPDAGVDRLAILAPGQIFVNTNALNALGRGPVQLQHGQQLLSVQIAGHIAANGPPLAVLDIAAAQDLLDLPQSLSKIQIKLRDGANPSAVTERLQQRPDWPADLQVKPPADQSARADALSRAYRVNLTVLALMALFTGAFLVYSVQSLSVTQRHQQYALLGILGLTQRQLQQLVLLETGVLAALGSALGLAAGTALAALALRLLGGDLGGGYFASTTPPMHWDLGAALLFGSLGLLAAVAGAWWPARQVLQMAPAQALKGLGSGQHGTLPRWSGPLLLLISALLALLPPVAGMPLAAYCSMAVGLIGGISTLPLLVGWLLKRVAPRAARHVLPLLAVERARQTPGSAAMAVSGVVAALSLAVAMTVMVSSFRQSVISWLDQMLPASLYIRLASAASAINVASPTSNSSTAFFAPGFMDAARRLPGVDQVAPQHTRPLSLAADKPAVTLMARALRDPSSGALRLPLNQAALDAPAQCIAIYVSEAMVDGYGARYAEKWPGLQKAFPAESAGAHSCYFVAGVWRDYAHQFGSVVLDLADLRRLQADPPITDLALWLRPETDVSALIEALRKMADQYTGGRPGDGARLLDFADSQEIRSRTLTIFDRSFAVTYWMQAVAIGIGLFGVATSFSAQVLARRKEFGLLVHLGLTSRQIVRLLATEAALWTLLGSLAGVGLGLAVAEVLVRVVNPQSFHWTMDLHIPGWRLLALAWAVIVAGTATAWFAGRNAAGRDVVHAVKQDW